MDVRAELRSVRAALEECLEAVDGGVPEEQRVRRAAQTVAESTRLVEELGARAAGLPAEELEALRAELEELVRLNAVASIAAARDKSSLAEGLARARDTRRTFAFYKEEGETGGSCDTSG